MAEFHIVNITTPEGTTDEVLQIVNSSTTNYRMADVITMAGQYTFSVWAKAAATMNVEFRVLGNVYTESITTAWKKVVFTVDASSTTYIDICPAADTALYLYKGMLQQGQFDTDWKPAPEDVDSEIATTKSLIQQTESSILQQVSSTYATKGEVQTVEGKVELKIGRDENDQIVSMLNAAADEINITGNRLAIDSTNFKLAADGTLTAMKLRGSDIDIETESTDASEKYNSSATIKTEWTDQVWGDDSYYYTLTLGTTYQENTSQITIDHNGICIFAPIVSITADTLELPGQFDRYTISANGVVDSGTITVQRTCNICHVYGQLTLTGKATAWIELTSEEFVLPAILNSNQYMYISVNIGWGTAGTAPAVLRLSPAGNLVLQYGQAGTCNFSFTYICE